MSSEPAGVPAPPSPEEPLAQRVLRQARTGQLDEDRLLPGQDKRERDLTKKLDLIADTLEFCSPTVEARRTGRECMDWVRLGDRARRRRTESCRSRRAAGRRPAPATDAGRRAVHRDGWAQKHRQCVGASRRHACQSGRSASTSPAGAWTPCAVSSEAVERDPRRRVPRAPGPRRGRTLRWPGRCRAPRAGRLRRRSPV